MGRYRRGIKPMFENSRWKIVTGDRVQIMSGRDKGQIGVVKEVIRDRQWPRVVVEGLNMVRRLEDSNPFVGACVQYCTMMKPVCR